MKLFSGFCIGAFLTLIACRLDPALAGKYPIWVYALGIAAQVYFLTFSWGRK